MRVKRPTIRDVAARAGVSHQTVSRVINGSGAVIAPTRERVLAAIRDLDYVPNGVARSLSSRRTHTLGVVTADISDYAFGQAVAGAEAAARQRGFFLVIGSVADAADHADEEAHLRLMLERGVEGIILDWPTLGGRPLPLLTARVPLVTIASSPDLPGVRVVDVDNRRGGFEATIHLGDLGHRTFATITGPLAWSAAAARLDGYRGALHELGLRPDPALIASGPDWGPASGQAGAARLLDTGIPFTALFAQSDLLALGAITELRARGLRVPEDVSVVGYDDIPVASFLTPPLTTMRQPIRQVGALAADLLIDEIMAASITLGDGPPRHLLSPQLVVRASTASRPER